MRKGCKALQLWEETIDKQIRAAFSANQTREGIISTANLKYLLAADVRNGAYTQAAYSMEERET